MTIREELTAGEVAAMLGWNREAVIRALETRKLQGRKVGKEALIWIDDAKVFVAFHQKRLGENS
jgi:hypothetical protein